LEVYVQAVQSDALIQRYDAIPAVAGPVGLVAETDTADIAFCERISECGCCCEEEGERGSEEGIHRRCSNRKSWSSCH